MPNKMGDENVNKDQLSDLMGELLDRGEIGSPDLSFLDVNEEDDGNFDVDDFHNKSTALAIKGKIKAAVDMCERGLERFPNDLNLLADLIKYCSDIGEDDTAEFYMAKLNETAPRRTWGWRPYMYVLDHLMKKPYDNEKACREIIADFKKYHIHEEYCYFAESELEEKLGNYERSKELLKSVINEQYNAPKCALRLLDLQLQHGEFEEALQTSNYFGVASCEVQPSTDQRYQLYVRCLAEDALLHKMYYKNGKVFEDDIERVRALYEKILKMPEIMIHYGSNIKTRIEMLDFLTISDI